MQPTVLALNRQANDLQNLLKQAKTETAEILQKKLFILTWLEPRDELVSRTQAPDIVSYVSKLMENYGELRSAADEFKMYFPGQNIADIPPQEHSQPESNNIPKD